jgi:uncharacterized protein (DUF1501 family)
MKTSMKRREFLRKSLLSSAAVGAGMSLPGQVMAACDTVSMPRTLVNLMLYGGMDSRFVFMPSPGHPDANYVSEIWQARQNLYPAAYPDYASMFLNEYEPVIDPLSGLEFGIFRECGWLKSEFIAGRVAVIANSFCSTNRRHDQSQLNANVGVPGYGELYYDRDGWGGRLVEQIAGSPNVVELSHEISVFCNGTSLGQRLAQAIHAKNTRDIALPNVNPGLSVTHEKNVITRALKSYYEARSVELANQTDSPFNLFFQHNTAFRNFGDQVKSRLDDCGALPAALSGLSLNSGHFAQQCRNLYDVCLAPDILNVGTVSMRYDGWDTHNSEYGRISSNLSDIFGSGGGLSTALGEIANIPTLDMKANEQLAFVVTTDFGRQLKANGDDGTDHGRGLYTIVMGWDVSGGLYGEMFPQRESEPDSNGKVPLQTSGADIQGRTSTERILAQACDWVQPGASGAVFPNAGASSIELDVTLDGLFSA